MIAALLGETITKNDNTLDKVSTGITAIHSKIQLEFSVSNVNSNLSLQNSTYEQHNVYLNDAKL